MEGWEVAVVVSVRGGGIRPSHDDTVPYRPEFVGLTPIFSYVLTVKWARFLKNRISTHTSNPAFIRGILIKVLVPWYFFFLYLMYNSYLKPASQFLPEKFLH